MELTITFHIPEDITLKLDEAGIPKSQQEAALEEAIFLHIQERFLVDEEEDIIEHAISYEE